jgi:hypothetical protein
MKPLDVATNEISFLVDQVIIAMEADITWHVLTHPKAVPEITIQFSGPDVAVLTANQREILTALEVLASEIRATDRPDLVSCNVAYAFSEDRTDS